MYYRIYGIMHQSGFNNEVGNASTHERALACVRELDSKRYPFYSFTEHLKSGSPALSITIGVTGEAPSAVRPLIEYKPNPMEDFALGSALFGALKEKQDAVNKEIASRSREAS